jgi:nitric oxide reductase large subunit
MFHYVDYAEAPKEGYWPFLGAVASGLEVVSMIFLGFI